MQTGRSLANLLYRGTIAVTVLLLVWTLAAIWRDYAEMHAMSHWATKSLWVWGKLQSPVLVFLFLAMMWKHNAFALWMYACLALDFGLRHVLLAAEAARPLTPSILAMAVLFIPPMLVLAYLRREDYLT
ncbi:hypothetical protein [Oceanomicrobium pacificus]|uniref:Uncharacterized protein n=1 Tax=Oceanomicrobium pacificus TaxID=2692916 RepID=A0A6B0TS10_9RHOB|nr:hypothetical protein [Oceanomicrobium pacificus]MXU64518.1 hypothetical protein [Oceanomicrobium pacificus]